MCLILCKTVKNSIDYVYKEEYNIRVEKWKRKDIITNSFPLPLVNRESLAKPVPLTKLSRGGIGPCKV